MKGMKIAIVIAAALLAASSLGCLRRAAALNNRETSERVFAKNGPMENYGAVCEKVDRDIAYAPGEDGQDLLKLDVYYNHHDGLAPIIVNIHGGGWEIGDKNDINSVWRSRWLCNKGYVVVNVNYRMKPSHPIQAQVEDVMGAVIWAKENAETYGADPKRVGVTGGSAGGHLTAMVAWASNDPYFKPTGHKNSEYDSDVLAAVPYYGVFDLEEMLTLRNSVVANVSLNYFTDSQKGPKREEIIKHISPKHHLRPDLPPTFFVCGDDDEFKLYAQSVRFEKELKDLGVPTGLYTARGAPHGFDSDYGKTYTQEAIAATAAWFDQYVKNAQVE